MLTQEQIDQYHHDGFLVIPGVFQGEELERLRAAADAVQAEGDAGQGEDHMYTEIDGVKRYFRSERMWDRDPVFRAVTVKPDLLEAIGQCIGHPFLPINDSFVCKLPRYNVPIPWHQDPPCGRADAPADTFGVPNFDTDIYLDDSTIENGCVWGIPQHHLVGEIKPIKAMSQEEMFNHPMAVPIEMKAGDVLFHSLSAPHGSIGNKTDTMRRIFYVHYMNREVVENSYPDWIGHKRCFTPEAFEMVNQMIEDRKALGWGGLEGAQLEITDEGLLYTGQPTTPPRYWDTLIARMSPEEMAAKRNLEAIPA